MKPAFYSGATGLLAYQSALDVIGNNIANVNTNGFRGQGTSFEDLLYTQMYANTDTEPKTGHGVRVVSTGIRTDPGSPRETGYLLDYAIVGEGMFAIEHRGEILYTRDGAFQLSLIDEQSAYLTMQDGSYVLDQNQQRIMVPFDQEKQQFDLNSIKERLGIFQFANESDMTAVSGNRYRPTELSGEAQLAGAGEYRILPGYIERSNVSLADEMADMIAAQRSFQVSSRVLMVADENEQTINGLRR